MITSLKSAKAHLSEYVELAGRGEEVVITVRGKARARLCPVRAQPDAGELEKWGQRLEEARARYAVRGKAKAASSQQLWDDLRGDRP
jgi:prevent-host-death family protein